MRQASPRPRTAAPFLRLLGVAFAAGCAGSIAPDGTRGDEPSPAAETKPGPGLPKQPAPVVDAAASTPMPMPQTTPDAGSTVADPGTPMSGRDFPCDVGTIVRSRCAGCHAAVPLYGAPMSLAKVEDFQPLARESRRKLFEVAKARVDAQTMPPKSVPPLSDPERATLSAWLSEGAPSVDAATCNAAPKPTPMPEKPKLGCTPDYVFVSQGATAAEGFPVPTVDNHYQCFNLPVPFEPQEQVTEWAPMIGDPRVVHHWILYAVKGTSTKCEQSKRFLFGWAPGGGGDKMPPDIGHELPNPDERLLLEVHYYNPMALTGLTDKTGVALCTTKKPRAKEAGVVTLGAIGIKIPPRAKNFDVTGACHTFETARFAEPLHVLSSWPHMHRLATNFRTTHTTFGKSSTLVEVKNWDFNDQVAYPHDHEKTIIRPGDWLATTCTYSNTEDHEVTFGERTQDEMCFNFMTVYPISAVKPTLDERPLRLCTDPIDYAKGVQVGADVLIGGGGTP